MLKKIIGISLFFVFSSSASVNSENKSNQNIKFRDFILDKTSYSQTLLMLKNNPEKYRSIEESKGAYSIISDKSYRDIIFLQNEVILKLKESSKELKNYDLDNRIKILSFKTDIFDSESNVVMFFYKSGLASIVLNFETMPLDEINAFYGNSNIIGDYKYKNIKEGWSTYCLTWLYQGNNCEEAKILNDWSQKLDFSTLSYGYLSESTSQKFLMYRNNLYKHLKSYISELKNKASKDLEAEQKERAKKDL